ncbi:MAG: hypothetical protein DRP78_00910 [Candidatus Omnitrophota bacterium]|nr:MAG: hypothetical protein DRP78_00910 [Candidatus Omnitrophota bacterium]
MLKHKRVKTIFIISLILFIQSFALTNISLGQESEFMLAPRIIIPDAGVKEIFYGKKNWKLAWKNDPFKAVVEANEYLYFVTGRLPKQREMAALFGVRRQAVSEGKYYDECDYNGEHYQYGALSYLIEHTENNKLKLLALWETKIHRFKAVAGAMEYLYFAKKRFPKRHELIDLLGVTKNTFEKGRYCHEYNYNGEYYQYGVLSYLIEHTENEKLKLLALWETKTYRHRFMAVAGAIEYIYSGKSYFSKQDETADFFGVTRETIVNGRYYRECDYNALHYKHGVLSYLIDHTEDEKLKLLALWETKIDRFMAIVGYLEYYFKCNEKALSIPNKKEIVTFFFKNKEGTISSFRKLTEYGGKIYEYGVMDYVLQNSSNKRLRDAAEVWKQRYKGVRILFTQLDWDEESFYEPITYSDRNGKKRTNGQTRKVRVVGNNGDGLEAALIKKEEKQKVALEKKWKKQRLDIFNNVLSDLAGDTLLKVEKILKFYERGQSDLTPEFIAENTGLSEPEILEVFQFLKEQVGKHMQEVKTQDMGNGIDMYMEEHNFYLEQAV